MGVTAATSVGLALALDALFEEFPGRVHPVALFGRLVAPFDRRWASPRLVGALVAGVLPLVAAAVAWGVTETAGRVGSPFGVVVAALALFGTTSLRMLLTVAAEVVDQSVRDVELARDSVSALAGRDPATLSAGELRSAAVESAAENLADGLVAPLLAFALGARWSLSLGVAAAAWVKAVNTLDSMLGYRSKPVGRASARLDDAVMWVPARVAAGLIAIAGGAPGTLRRARTWSREPDSPNSGWPMATLAVALDVELTKPGQYALNPGAGLPTPARARAGLRIVGTAGALAFLLAGVVAWF